GSGPIPLVARELALEISRIHVARQRRKHRALGRRARRYHRDQESLSCRLRQSGSETITVSPSLRVALLILPYRTSFTNVPLVVPWSTATSTPFSKPIHTCFPDARASLITICATPGWRPIRTPVGPSANRWPCSWPRMQVNDPTDIDANAVAAI